MSKLLKHFHRIRKRRSIGYFLKNFNLNNIICEVGVRYGSNFHRLLNAAQPTIIYGVDIWKADEILSHNDIFLSQEDLDKIYNTLKKSEEQDSRIKIIKDYSINTAKSFPDNFFDFVHLDADHTYEAVKEDIKAWWPKVKINGILSGHDYKQCSIEAPMNKQIIFGVIQAINEMKEEYNIQHFHTTHENFATWLFLKES